MLRYALTEEGSLVSVDEETAQPPYFCPECLTPLGKKMGPERAWHFFHFEGEEKRSCKRRGDTEKHQALQKLLIEQLQEQNPSWVMEYPIQEARRIADLALPAEKIALEIQRSSISLDGLLQRSEAYWQSGWSVIWLVSLSLYRTSSLPRKLQEVGIVPHYFFEEEEPFRLWDILNIRTQRKIPSLFVLKREGTLCGKKRDQWTVHLKGDFLDRPPEEQTVSIARKNRIKKLLSLLWLRLIGT